MEVQKQINKLYHKLRIEQQWKVTDQQDQESKGIVELLKGENAFKGVVVEELEDNTISIELYVILQYGTNISTVANNIIDRVKYTVEKITSINVSKIDINVQGIRVK